jgi:Sensors of blue-light using FAD
MPARIEADPMPIGTEINNQSATHAMTSHPPIFQLIYFSHRAPDSSLSAIEVICERAFLRNRQDDVTGLLLYNDRLFLQFIEGPRDAVIACYGRIRHDERHYSPNVIWEHESETRLFIDGAAMRIEEGDYERFASIVALSELENTDIAQFGAAQVRNIGASRLNGFMQVAALSH